MISGGGLCPRRALYLSTWILPLCLYSIIRHIMSSITSHRITITIAITHVHQGLLLIFTVQLI